MEFFQLGGSPLHVDRFGGPERVAGDSSDTRCDRDNAFHGCYSLGCSNSLKQAGIFPSDSARICPERQRLSPC